MRKNTKIAALISVCVVVLLSVSVVLLYGDCIGGLMGRFYYGVLLQRDFVSKDIKFKRILSANGHSVEGNPYDVQTVRGSDCIEITKVTERTKSEADAARKLDEITLSASKVIERGAKKDNAGHIVGERALLVFKDREKGAIIIWMNSKGVLITIESSSIAHSVAYERYITSPRADASVQDSEAPDD